MAETITIFDNKTQREITLPDGYRICIQGEILRAGDKYFSSLDGKWIHTSMFNEPVGGGLTYITKKENPVRMFQFGKSSCCAEVVHAVGKKEFKFSSLQKA
jgi:hypothetical protein